MDAFITREAAADIDALGILRTGPGAWGFLVGHKRGRRVFVERLFPAGSGAVPPPAERLDELDRRLAGRIVGLFAVRPGAAWKKAVLEPHFYGRLFLDLRLSKKGPCARPYVVEFDRRFFLAPVLLGSGPKGGTP
jgi:hypothetical protein